MKNKLADLNNHLFAQLERLSEEGISAETLEQEVKRAGAIVEVADQITRNADLQLKAAKLFADHGATVLPHLPMIGKAEA
jgi:glycerol-3-phosphate dehydrogenase